MPITTRRIQPGLWNVGGQLFRRNPGKSGKLNRGQRTIPTWVEVSTGKIIGYTLADVVIIVQGRTDRAALKGLRRSLLKLANIQEPR